MRKVKSLGRHRRNCSVCAHAQRVEIEAEFVGWRSPAVLAQQYGLADRASIYRHAHAVGLFHKRRQNMRGALERIIERVDEVQVTASSIVGAAIALARINANGEWIDQSERVSVHDLFSRMSRTELEAYAQDGKLPHWFSRAVATDALAGNG